MNSRNGSPIRILLAEPCSLMRAGLKRLLEDEIDLEVVAEAPDLLEIADVMRQASPDILLVNTSLWSSTAPCRLADAESSGRDPKIVLLGDVPDERQLHISLELGVRGCLNTNSSADLLIKCIRAVANGEYWLDRATLVAACNKKNGTTSALPLTAREIEIVAHIVAGSSNARIADELHISEETVKRHLANIYPKLGVGNRLELAMYAVRHQLVNGSVSATPAKVMPQSVLQFPTRSA